MGKHFFYTLIISILVFAFSETGLHAQGCLPPDYSEVYSITSTTAVIYWEDYNGNNRWEIAISPTELDDPSTAAIFSTVTGDEEYATFDAQNLTHETLYHYYIRANCNTYSHSSWIEGTFTTRCADKTVPHSENFNGYTANMSILPECWTTIQGAAAVTSSDAAHGNVLQIQGYSAVALPTFNLPVNTLRIRFSAMAPNTSTPLQLGIAEDVSDLSSFTLIDVVSLQSEYVFFEKTVNFSSYTGTGHYIVFRNTGNNIQYIDDVTVSVIPDCFSPENLQVNALHTTSATISWEEAGDASQWQLILSTTPVTNFNTQDPITVNSTTYNANALQSNTTYYFYVRAVCSSENSEWASLTFSTPCSAALTPVSESFIINQTPSCWSRERVVGNADISFVGYGDNPSCSPAAGSAMVKWPCSNTGWQTRLISLPLNTTGSAILNVNFKWNHDLNNSNGPGDGVQLQYSTDGLTWANSAQGVIHRYDGTHNGWTEYDAYIPEASNQPVVYVGFLFTSDGSGANCYLDEVNFRNESGCITPVNVTAHNISGNGATITWDEVGTATTWNLLLSETPVTNFSGTSPVTLQSPTYSASGLNPSTTYYVYVRAKCSNSSFSEWTDATTFTTECGTILSLPYKESFDSYGTCTNAFPPCWIRHGMPDLGTYYHNGQTCYTPSATDINSTDGDKSLMVCTPSGCYTYTITPPFQENVQNLAVTFFLFKSAANTGTLEVGVMSNPNDPVTFESVTTVEPSVVGEWKLFNVSLSAATLSGSGNRIAFRHYGMIDENYYLIDGVTFHERPDCWYAHLLSANEITGSSATLSWFDLNTPSAQWNVKISSSPMSDLSQTANVYDQTVSASPITIDYLSGNTTYYYYVQSDCSDDTHGSWSSGSFTTFPCNCYVDIYMNDAWANGWEGAKIQLKHGTTVFGEATMSNGAHDTVRIYTCEAQNIDYYFVSGNNDDDISFSIVNSLGTTIYTTNGTPAEGCFTSGMPACGISCGTAPSGLTATGTAEGALLTWTAAPDAITYTVYRNNTLLADYITTTTYTDQNPTTGSNCYTVTAKCIVGESSPSNESCFTGIDDRELSHNVSIFPNPTNDKFTVTADFPFNHISVTNLLGQEVINKEVAGSRTEISVSGLSKGIYLVRILDGQNSIVRKIVVE